MLFDDDFLLESDVARDLYQRYAAGQPIIDYHCHLPPEHVACDHRFRSLTATQRNQIVVFLQSL